MEAAERLGDAPIGSDVLDQAATDTPGKTVVSLPQKPGVPKAQMKSSRTVAPRPPRRFPRWRGGFVLTRLHVRYDDKSLTEDLVFIDEAAEEKWERRFLMHLYRRPA